MNQALSRPVLFINNNVACCEGPKSPSQYLSNEVEAKRYTGGHPVIYLALTEDQPTLCPYCSQPFQKAKTKQKT